MTDIWLVLQTEFGRKIRSRIYLIATLGGAAGIVALILSPILFTSVAKTQTNALIVAAAPAIRTRAVADLKTNFEVVATFDDLPPVVTRTFLDEHGNAAAALRVTEIHHRLHVDVYARDLTAFDDVQFRALVPYNIELATGIPSARSANLQHIDRSLHGVETKFRTSDAANLGHAFAFGSIFLLYFAIVLASQTVMSAVAEEKTSRIAEILVATINPVDLLTGKTFAAAALAVVQIVVWAIASLAALPVLAFALSDRSPAAVAAAAHATAAANAGAAHGTAPPSASLMATALGAIDGWSLLAFAVFFALGYLQYATLYAAAASLVLRTEDLGAVTTPIIMPAIVAFLFAQYAIVSPDSPAVIVAGFVPLVSPFVMFARVAIASVPPWQIAIAFTINLATVAASFYAAGKIYRVGMLISGKLPTPRQIWAAIRS